MSLELVNKLANAVLYEGYMLYPYRASAVKNRQRWNFGTLYPEAFTAVSGGTEACVMQTQCLVIGSEETAIDVRVRFLHLLARDVAELNDDSVGTSCYDWRDFSLNLTPGSRIVDSLEVEGKLFQSWQEAIERDVEGSELRLTELSANSRTLPVEFGSTIDVEPLCTSEGQVAGAVIRNQEKIQGSVEVWTEQQRPRLFKLTVRISNQTQMPAMSSDRNQALMRSLVSTH